MELLDFEHTRGREPIVEGEKPVLRIQNPWYGDEAIKKYARAGIYTISVDNKILYIGQSKNMHTRLSNHKSEIREPCLREKKYEILKEAIAKGKTIQFDVLYYAKRVRDEAQKKELNEREAYYINKYLPPLNTQIPAHEKFPKQTSLIHQVNTIEDAINLAKGGK